MHYPTLARPSSPCSTIGSNYSGEGKSRTGRRCKEKSIADLERPLAELERLKYKRSRRRASRQRRRDEFMVQRTNAVILLQALLRGAHVRTKIAKLKEKVYQEKQLRIRRMEEWARYISSIQEIAEISTAESTFKATRGINNAVELGRKRKAAGEKISNAIKNHLARRRISVDLIIRMWRQHHETNADWARRKLSPEEAERARRKKLVMEKRRMRHIRKKEVEAQKMLAKSKLEGEKERLEVVRNKKLQHMKLAAKARRDEEIAKNAKRIEREANELKSRNLEEIKRKEMEGVQLRKKQLEMAERKKQAARRLASKDNHTNQDAIPVEKGKGPTMTVQETTNEHQKTTDHTDARSSISHRSVLKDAAKFGAVPKATAPISQTKGGGEQQKHHDSKLSKKKSPLPPPILSTTSGLPTSPSGGNGNNDVPLKKLSKETSPYSRTQHRVPHVRRKSNDKLLQENKKPPLANAPTTTISSRGTKNRSSMQQRPVSLAMASSVPSPPRNELQPGVNDRLLAESADNGVVLPPLLSKQTVKDEASDKKSQWERQQTHSTVDRFGVIDDNKFEDDISDIEALLMIQ